MSLSVQDWWAKWEQRKQGAKIKMQERIDNGLLQLKPTQSYSVLVEDLCTDDVNALKKMYEQDGWVVTTDTRGYLKFKLPKHG